MNFDFRLPASKLALALTLGIGAAAGSAQAVDIYNNSSPVTIKLFAPGGYSINDVVTPTPVYGDVTISNVNNGFVFAKGVGKAPSTLPSPYVNKTSGDATGVSKWLGTQEKFVFRDDGLTLLIQGYLINNGYKTTGWLGAGGQHARYEISGLDLIGKTITGISMQGSDGETLGLPSPLTSPSNFNWVSLSAPGTITVNLDELRFGLKEPGNASDLLKLDITYVTQAVPEPSSVVLMGLGGLLVAGRLRRRARQQA